MTGGREASANGSPTPRSSFDVVVVGGGAYGAWAAFEAARRGLDVAIVERGDWGCGTSSASSKLIHGGLRYLERLELSLVRSALRERRALRRIAGHLVHPLRFVIPRRGGDRVGSLKLRVGLALYDLLSGRDRTVPGIESVNSAGTRDRWPFLAPDVRRAFCYPDCGTDDARLVLEVVMAARAAGAYAASHTEVTEVLGGGGGVRGVRVRDVVSGVESELATRAVILAAGPWVGGIRGADAPAIRLVRGTHAVLPPLGTTDAVLTFAREDGRVVFLVPWFGATLLGTTEVDVDDIASPRALQASDDEVDYLLRVAAETVDRDWTRADVRGTFAGVRTLASSAKGSAFGVSRELSVARPRPGLHIPIGGKLTTSRVDAAAIVEDVAASLGRRLKESSRPLLPDLRTGRVADLVRERPDLDERLVADVPVSAAQLVDAARHEDVCHLDDVLRRRTPFIVLTRERGEPVERAAALVGAERGWDRARIAAEVARVRDLHPIV